MFIICNIKSKWSSYNWAEEECWKKELDFFKSAAVLLLKQTNIPWSGVCFFFYKTTSLQKQFGFFFLISFVYFLIMSSAKAARNILIQLSNALPAMYCKEFLHVYLSVTQWCDLVLIHFFVKICIDNSILSFVAQSLMQISESYILLICPEENRWH